MNTTVEEVPAPRPESPDWVVLSDTIADRHSMSGGHPILGRERTEIGVLYKILTFVVKKLYTEGRLTDENIPVPSGSKRHIVHTKSVHPTGEPFTRLKASMERRCSWRCI